jgi:allantoate deiminase
MKSLNVTIDKMLEELACFSSGEHEGVTRLLYDDNWVKAQKYLLELGEDLGLNCGFDEVGNVILVKTGASEDERAVTVGSHIDSVVNAGKYDGIYGVVTAVVALKELLSEYGAPKKTIQILSFCEEEGSRFPFTFTGSKYITNQLSDDVNHLIDKNGVSFKTAHDEAIQSLTEDFSKISAIQPSAYAEIHIEQGPVLEHLNKEIGIVTAIVAQKRFTVTVKGQSNHAGTTPMWMRIDPLKQAVQLISQLETVALKMGAPFVFTVGEMAVSPNASNVIPDCVTFSIDIRHTDTDELQVFESLIHELIAKQIENVPTLEIDIDKWTDVASEAMNDTYINNLKTICDEKGLSYNLMPSGAGHDTQIMNQITSTALIFVPSINGVSHSPLEFTKTEDLEKGKDVFKQFIYDLAY